MRTHHEYEEREAREEDFQPILDFYGFCRYVARKEEKTMQDELKTEADRKAKQ